jgi:hypothetical protein
LIYGDKEGAGLMRVWLKLLWLVLCLDAALISTAARADGVSAENGAFWAVKTAGGCKLILNAGVFHANENLTAQQSWESKMTFSYQGGCGANGFADGNGVMTVVDSISGDGFVADYRFTTTYRGNFKNGLMEGSFAINTTGITNGEVMDPDNQTLKFLHGCDQDNENWGCDTDEGLAQQKKFAGAAVGVLPAVQVSISHFFGVDCFRVRHVGSDWGPLGYKPGSNNSVTTKIELKNICEGTIISRTSVLTKRDTDPSWWPESRLSSSPLHPYPPSPTTFNKAWPYTRPAPNLEIVQSPDGTNWNQSYLSANMVSIWPINTAIILEYSQREESDQSRYVSNFNFEIASCDYDYRTPVELTMSDRFSKEKIKEKQVHWFNLVTTAEGYGRIYGSSCISVPMNLDATLDF